jgi:glucokinase
VVTRSPNFPDWKNVPLRDELSSRLDVPFWMDNDANMAALGERWMGAGRGKSSFCMITLGTGIGGGIFLDGRIFRGDRGMAGEIGHMTVHPDGYPCGCGNTGCWELYASANGLLRLTEELKKNTGEGGSREGNRKNPRFLPTSPVLLGRWADRGDPFALSVFRRYGRYLGIGIANLANVLDVATFVIGGGVLGSWRHFADSARREIRRRAYVFVGRKVDLRKAACGDMAGILGAAYTVYDTLEPGIPL